MSQFKKGDRVKQVVTPISGVVKSFSVCQESGNIQYLVEYSDADGEVRERYFQDGEVEAE